MATATQAKSTARRFDNPVAFERRLVAEIAGQLEPRFNVERLAIVLNQLVWVFDHSDSDWLSRSYEQWTGMFPWLTAKQLRDAVNQLEQLGYLETSGRDDRKAILIRPTERCDGQRRTPEDEVRRSTSQGATVNVAGCDGQRRALNEEELSESLLERGGAAAPGETPSLSPAADAYEQSAQVVFDTIPELAATRGLAPKSWGKRSVKTLAGVQRQTGIPAAVLVEDYRWACTQDFWLQRVIDLGYLTKGPDSWAEMHNQRIAQSGSALGTPGVSREPLAEASSYRAVEEPFVSPLLPKAGR